ncbi:MAG TPA: lanthionine synthetase LanC family protein [Puia sp.]|nr:lanthionine synthetase LanC family protein [Puia sp.]
MYGKFGAVLLFGYLYQYSNRSELYDRFNSALDESFELLEGTEADMTFGRGHAGFAWCLQHLIGSGFLDADIDDLTGDVMDKLHASSDQLMGKGDYDYLLGGLGSVMFGLERAKYGYTDPWLNTVVEGLAGLAVPYGQDVFIWEQVLHDAPARINLGLAHGMPGLLVFLSKCCNLDIEADICGRLAEGNYKFLMKAKQHNSLSCYAYSMQDGEFQGSTPLRWCYGDVGIAASLVTAGSIMRRQDWQEEGISLGLRCVERLPGELSGLADAHLCHGSAGVGHVFNRLYQHTKLQPFREGALFCLQDTLRRAIHHQNYISFMADKGDFGKLNIDGLMEGSIGIALSLLALIDTHEPGWDSSFLLS